MTSTKKTNHHTAGQDSWPGDSTTPFALLLSMLQGARGLLLLAAAASLVSGFGSAAMVALINQALSAQGDELGALGLRFMLLGVAVLLLRLLSQTLFMYLGQRAKASVRLRTIRHIANASYAHLERFGGGRPLAILTGDLDTLVVLFINLPTIMMQSTVIIGCLAYLGWLSWQILLFALLAIGIGAVGFLLVNSRALEHLRGSRQREDDLIQQFRALFDGAKELKLHRSRREAFIDDTLAPHIESVRVQRTLGYVLFSAASSWGNLVLFAFVGLTLFVLARSYGVDHQVMSGYAMIFLYMILPIEGLLAALPTLGSARIALERIARLETQLPAEIMGEQGADTGFQRIELRALTHRYFREKENSYFMLGPVDLVFTPGEITYLIGGNGSGKTTLAKLLVGLYEGESGSVLLDGQPVEAATRDAYRQRFSTVFSDFFLFDTLLGVMPAHLEPQARSLLKALQLEHKVSIENGAFTTLNLSQGQRKRLALLVALLEDRAFYVFDEWAADQDPAFKEVFYRSLLPDLKARGKAVLVITHDDRYFALADRRIKLEMGQIVAELSDSVSVEELSVR
ncbi:MULTISPECIES: cyclic peptide export ABC transporter [Pseudomonas]|uniref:Cyclic peptide export ABC transporter n=1 Tax=Pseudomonas gingeri TaxID=117681 RepID=A0A7Y8BK08_9PSED|nr:cyclic peptide export ABC transporter [Pseudomonas gingeri]NWB46575.1 cyclic peptide export ABC transporter [Pseudomonas gingeri]